MYNILCFQETPFNYHKIKYNSLKICNISKKMSDHGKKGFFTYQYTAGICKNSGMWLVYGSSCIKSVCESHKND